MFATPFDSYLPFVPLDFPSHLLRAAVSEAGVGVLCSRHGFNSGGRGHARRTNERTELYIFCVQDLSQRLQKCEEENTELKSELAQLQKLQVRLMQGT